MKSIFTATILIAICCALPSSVQARTLKALFNYTIFNVPDKGPYIETYLSVAGESVVFEKNKSDQFQAMIEVTYIFRQNNEIKEFDKYQLYSPEITDTTQNFFDFIDQQRYFMPEGVYEMEIIIADLKAGKKPFSAIQPVSIRFEKDNVCFSGIQLVKSITPVTEANILTKGGYDLVPMVYNFFPESLHKFTYYTEIYNAEIVLGQGEKFLVTSNIRSFETGNPIREYASYKRMDAKPVVTLLNEYDISRLPSGNYTLVIEARNKNNEILSVNELFFQRSNPNIEFNLNDLTGIDIQATFACRFTNNDTLQEHLRCLVPIAIELEKNFIYKQSPAAELKTKQQFFYNFWLARDLQNPEKAWQDYYFQVQAVNIAYKTQIQKGYETDRGRVYLKYGPPNVISESYNEPSSYPYEIWHYYELSDNQRNKRFVFYTHDLVTNNFTLLHSDAIGEVSNYRWQVFLNSRWYDPYNVDVRQAPGIYGGRADDYYRNPR
ncbi:MAG: GWxTD domain-containing protein [Bacteroidales bacterium]|nr:GWxTD domain-containing protein [Bacteroidales bacterium]